MVAKKKNGELRICIDLRSLNKNIWVDSHPLPKIPDMLSLINGSKWFSKLDLASAYHQVVLDPSSRHLTAFISHVGSFQYCCMPFALASAAAVFQRIMSNILKGIKGVLVFQDDVLVHGETLDSHDDILLNVLGVLRDAGVVLKKEKCTFKVQKVEYLGHVLSEHGVEPRPGLVKAIMDCPPPKDKTGLKSFIRLCEFYSRFIPDYASKVQPLSNMLKKNVSFLWDDCSKKSFEWVKDQLVSSKILKPFDANAMCTITVDASGLGAILTQTVNGQENTLGYASRVLHGSELNFAVIERELLACWWAIRKFSPYIWGKHFILRTDHSPLVSILSGDKLKEHTPRIARLSTKLLQYDFEVVYIPGNKNVREDYFSRHPVECEDETDEDEEGCFVASLILDDMCAVSEVEWRELLSKDVLLCEVIKCVKDGWPREKNAHLSLQTFVKVSPELSVEDGLLVRGDRLVPPDAIRFRLIRGAHEGHLGKTFMKRRLREHFWWPQMDKDVDVFVGKCVCSNSEKSLKIRTPPLQPIDLPSRAWEKIGIDLVGPFNMLPVNSRFAIVAID